MSDSSSPSLGARHAKSFSTKIFSVSPLSRTCSPGMDTCSVVAHASTAVSGNRIVKRLLEKNAAALTLAGLLSTLYRNSLPPGKPVLADTTPLARNASTSPRVSRNRMELSLILSFTFFFLISQQSADCLAWQFYSVAHADEPPAAGGLVT